MHIRTFFAGGRSTLAAQKTKTYQCIPLYTSMTQTESRAVM